MRRHSDVSFWSHLGWDIADHTERHHDVATDTLMSRTFLGRCHDVSLAPK